MQFENSARTAIQSLEIEGRSREPERTIEITIGGRFTHKVAVSIRGEEMDVSALKTKISDTIFGMKAWYSVVAKVDLFYVWTVIGFLFITTIAAMTPGEDPRKPGRSFQDALRIVLQLTGSFVAIGFVVAGAGKLRSRFFPMISFATAQGIKRHQFDEQVRWTVIVSFLVGLAGAAVYGVIGGA